MLTHGEIWAAIDALARENGMTASALARRAGLDPTTFNRSKRITREGVLIIKAQRHRTQEQNREDALLRLQELLSAALKPQKPRYATQPTFGSRQRRLDEKSQRSSIKSARRPVAID